MHGSTHARGGQWREHNAPISRRNVPQGNPFTCWTCVRAVCLFCVCPDSSWDPPSPSLYCYCRGRFADMSAGAINHATQSILKPSDRSVYNIYGATFSPLLKRPSWSKAWFHWARTMILRWWMFCASACWVTHHGDPRAAAAHAFAPVADHTCSMACIHVQIWHSNSPNMPRRVAPQRRRGTWLSPINKVKPCWAHWVNKMRNGSKTDTIFVYRNAHYHIAAGSSVGRASDWRSECPRFDPGSRHFLHAYQLAWHPGGT